MRYKEIADHAKAGNARNQQGKLDGEIEGKPPQGRWMSMEDDYMNSRGIINNGLKEDKTTEVKAPRNR